MAFDSFEDRPTHAQTRGGGDAAADAYGYVNVPLAVGGIWSPLAELSAQGIPPKSARAVASAAAPE